MQKSIMFFIKMFPVFFARVKPASQSANPACIKKTNAAQISTQETVVTLNFMMHSFTNHNINRYE